MFLGTRCVLRLFSEVMRTLAQLVMFASRLSLWKGSLISMPRCLLRSLLPLFWGWHSCFAVDSPAVLAALSGFLRRLRVLAAMLFGLRFQMAMVGMLAALSTLWRLLWLRRTLGSSFC